MPKSTFSQSSVLLFGLAVLASFLMARTDLPNSKPNPKPPTQGPVQSQGQYAWGVDSASPSTTLHACVTQSYGTPKYWGRYLKDVAGVSKGLTKQEIAYLHDKHIKILPIYNNFSSATGYDNGKKAGQDAVNTAKALGIPSGVYLFADIEANYSADAGWIRGWYDALNASTYQPGIYENPVTGPFANAYNSAVKQNPAIGKETVLWSAQPSIGVTRADKTPKFGPSKPAGANNTLAWQYGIQGSACNIDTNLIDTGLLSRLW